jgi:hypothetical protein
MSTEFQIIFTAIMTLLAGLALFVLKNVFKKLEELDGDLKVLSGKVSTNGERLTKVETKIEVCPYCGLHRIHPNGRGGDQ